MTKREELNQNAPAELQLRQLAKLVTSHHQDVSLRLRRMRDYGRDCVTDGVLCGNALLRAKGLVPHGEWQAWLTENCPTLRYENARAYMKLAKMWPQYQAISESTSIRAALMLCADDEPKTNGDSETTEPYLCVLRGLSRLVVNVGKHPVAEWPEDGREKLKAELEPLAAAAGFRLEPVEAPRPVLGMPGKESFGGGG